MYQEKTVIVDNIPVSYREFKRDKDTPVSLLLHGWGSNKESFAAIQKEIPNSLSIDLPGFGKTPQPKKSWTVEDYANFVKNFIIKVQLGDIDTVLGHSFGGRVAVEAISHGTFMPKFLCLTGTPIIREKKKENSFLLSLGRIVKSLPGGTFARSFYYKKILGVEDYLDAEKSGMKSTFINVINKEALGDLKKIDIPILFLWGENDQTITIDQAYLASNQVVKGKVDLVPKADHFAFVDAPDIFVNKFNTWKESF